ncbi:hypothetical protein ACU4GR_12955 [Methylobacterium oryzae CBMB20]
MAADQSAEPNQAAPHATATPMTAPQRRADSEAGQLSTDGAAAYRDVHLARLAIYEAKPEQARMLVSHAQSALEKAKTDSTAFTKAEADLKPPSGMARSRPDGRWRAEGRRAHRGRLGPRLPTRMPTRMPRTPRPRSRRRPAARPQPSR